MGREVWVSKYGGHVLEDGTVREQTRNLGTEYVKDQTEVREEWLGLEVCDVNLKPWKECDKTVVHFSKERANVVYCNEVLCGVCDVCCDVVLYVVLDVVLDVV